MSVHILERKKERKREREREREREILCVCMGIGPLSDLCTPSRDVHAQIPDAVLLEEKTRQMPHTHIRFTCIHTHTCIKRTYAHTHHIRTYAHTRIIHAHTRIIHIYTHIRTCTHAYARTHVRTYTQCVWVTLSAFRVPKFTNFGKLIVGSWSR